MEDKTFIVHSDWLDCIAGLPLEQQDKVIAEIVRYGTEIESRHADDAVVQAFVNMVKGRIDFSKDKYSQKVNGGNTSGRKKKVDNFKIWELAHNEHRDANEISEILDISKSAVDHSDGWKRRKESTFCEV